MGCCGPDSERVEVKEIHKWHYINLNDFKSSSCFIFFSYAWVWILAIVAVAVYAADTFTAVKLLAFNQWSSEVQPAIPFSITKWIFAGCIIFSWTLLCYEWLRAIRVMKKQSITEDYLDPLAVVLQSIKIPGGYRRFLVFAELTKSKKKAAWVAIFVYFQRKVAIRILAAEGPRQVLNGITLYSVARARFVDGPHEKGDSLITSFFKNVKTLAIQDRTQVIILSSMAFTAIIWVISMLLLLLALLLWIFFIWAYVRNETLTGYCRRKVENRLARAVKTNTDKIWAKQERQNQKLALKEDKSDLDLPRFGGMKRQPTLPMFGESFGKDGFVSRNDSVSTLPRYQSQPQTPSDDYPPSLSRKPSMPSRLGTPASPFAQNASLLGNAGEMGENTISRPSTANSNRTFNSVSSRAPTLPPLSISSSDPRFPPPARPSPLSSTAERRFSPPNANPTPWRTPVLPVNEAHQEFEMERTSGGVPSALRPAYGQRRDVSSPGPQRAPMPFPGPVQRSFTGPPGPAPRSNPGAAPLLPRSMTPGAGPPMNSRTMTPSLGMRNQTPVGPPLRRNGSSDYNGGPPGMAL